MWSCRAILGPGSMDDFEYHLTLWGDQLRMVRAARAICEARGIDPELAEGLRLAALEGDADARDDALADLLEAVAETL